VESESIVFFGLIAFVAAVGGLLIRRRVKLDRARESARHDPAARSALIETLREDLRDAVAR